MKGGASGCDSLRVGEVDELDDVDVKSAVAASV